MNLSTFVDESKVREMITLHRRVSGGDDIQRIKNNTSLIPVFDQCFDSMLPLRIDYMLVYPRSGRVQESESRVHDFPWFGIWKGTSVSVH